MNNNAEFLRKYNELDALIGEKFNREEDDSSIYFLINKYRKSRIEIERIYSNKLDSVRRIRNLMVHESGIIDSLFDVFSDVLDFLDELISYLRNPVLAQDVMTPTKKLILGREDDLISVLIRKVIEEGISNIPIVDEKNVVIGIFNSDVLLNLFVNNYHINENSRIKDIKEFTSLESQLNLRFIFVTKEYEIDVLNDYFSMSKEIYKKRLPAIFVSENGKQNSLLIGVISPIDLIRKK